MPFIFKCGQCGAVLYEDPSPNLHDGFSKRLSYMEHVVLRIGGECPRCGRILWIPPVDVEVFAPKKGEIGSLGGSPTRQPNSEGPGACATLQKAYGKIGVDRCPHGRIPKRKRSGASEKPRPNSIPEASE